jgi:uncharacterized protein YbjT (DUF2867 family)
LLEQNNITEVYSIGRNSTGIFHPKLKEIFLKNNLLEEPIAADAFICCLGTTMKKAGSKSAFKAIDLDLPLYIASKLKDYGCRMASVISSMGADEGSVIFYSKIKGQMEKAMMDLHFESLSILRPSIIAGPREEIRTGEKIGLAVMKFIDPVLPFKNYKYILASDIAKALVKTAVKSETGCRIYLSNDIKILAHKSEP